MLVETRGIVLHVFKYSDTSLICRVFTEVLGLQSYMIKGVRSAKSNSKAAILRPPNVLEMVVYSRPNKGLQNVKEFRLNYIYKTLPYDIVKSSIALFMIEVLNKSVKEEEQNEVLFDYIFDSLQALDESEINLSYAPHKFLLGLAPHLGFGPGGFYATQLPYFDLKEGGFVEFEPAHPHYLKGEYAEVVSALINETQPNRLNNEGKRYLLDILLRFYALHIESFGEVKSHKVLQDVLRG